MQNKIITLEKFIALKKILKMLIITKQWSQIILNGGSLYLVTYICDIGTPGIFHWRAELHVFNIILISVVDPDPGSAKN